MLSGPIPAHPHYDKSDVGSYIDMPVPRVRPEARDIAAKAQGTVGVLLQVEGHRVPTGFRRARKSVIIVSHAIIHLCRIRFYAVNNIVNSLLCVEGAEANQPWSWLILVVCLCDSMV